MRHRLTRIGSFPGLVAYVHRVEGTSRLVLELPMFGFAYASRWILLRPSIDTKRLDDADFMADVDGHASKYGKVLVPGRDLFFEGQDLEPHDHSVSIELE